MPIYEFFCEQCNTVYNFFSRTVNTEKIPFCPTCKTVPLKRQMSVFAKITPGREEPAGEDMPLLMKTGWKGDVHAGRREWTESMKRIPVRLSA